MCAALSGIGCDVAHGQEVYSIERLFDIAESHSVLLRPSLAAETVAEKETRMAEAERLPDLTANLSLSYIGDVSPPAAICATIRKRLSPISATV